MFFWGKFRGRPGAMGFNGWDGETWQIILSMQLGNFLVMKENSTRVSSISDKTTHLYALVYFIII